MYHKKIQQHIQVLLTLMGLYTVRWNETGRANANANANANALIPILFLTFDKTYLHLYY